MDSGRQIRRLGTALCLLGLLSGAVPVHGSDWIEDAMRAPGDMPPLAPDHNAHVAQGAYLTGNASITGTGIPVTRQRPVGPTPSYRGYEEQGADVAQFMLNARTDTVVPPTSLQGWLQRTHPEFNLAAQTNPDAVLEIKGAWDDSSKILKSMGIRYHEMKAKELRDYPLDNARVIVINCEGKVPADAVERVRQWVIRGGYLISTDWTLGNFLERAFPGMVAFNGKKVAGETVDAMLMPGEQQLLAGTQVVRATWKLDDDSEEVRILRPDAVHVIARSFRLAETDPNRRTSMDPMQWGVLACDFNYGRGKVLHLVGHFDYNSSLGFLKFILPDAIPGAGIGLRQAIATNFLLEALQRPDKKLPRLPDNPLP